MGTACLVAAPVTRVSVMAARSDLLAYFRLLVELIDRHWELLYTLLVVVGLVIYVAASHSLHQRRHPSAAIAWVLGIILMPIVVLPLYLAFGSRKIIPRRVAESMRHAAVKGAAQYASARQTTANRSQQLGVAMDLPPAVAYGALTVHGDGEEARAALLRVIDAAEQTLDVSTFVFARDALGDEVAEHLKQRARAGVRVRLLIDGIGVYIGGYPDIAGMTAAGIEVVRFVPPLRSPKRGRTNLRNHRKFVVADRQVLWCGGRNLAGEYFTGDTRPLIGGEAWLDLSFDLRGELAAQAARQFEEDLAFATERFLPALPPPPLAAPGETHLAIAQLVPSGPDRVDDTILTLLVSAGFTSQKRILAITPYFVPDPSLVNSLALAARRGVRVDIVLPRRSNHRLADFARHRALRELVAAGAHVWQHPRMVHAKAVIVDDELALVGSANLDGRSLFLNYELMVAFYDRRAVRDFAHWIEERRSESAVYAGVRPGVLRELAEGVILWLAFQL